MTNGLTSKGFPWKVGSTYRLRRRSDAGDLLLGLDPDKLGRNADIHLIFGSAKIHIITNPDLPYGFQLIHLQVNGMKTDRGEPLLLVTAPSDLRIARTVWELTAEEVVTSETSDETSPDAYQSASQSRYFIKDGRLYELEDTHSNFIKRSLVRYENAYRWRRGGMKMNAFTADVKFISEDDAIRYEKALRRSLKGRLE